MTDRLTDEERQEPLPDLMYSRDIAIRLLRHAVWHLNYGDERSNWNFDMAYGDRDTIQLLAAHQRDVLAMSTGDFYRIKIIGTPSAYIHGSNA